MIVICLEGCHACGKTELCKRFERDGFRVLDEGFLDMPTSSPKLHPQSLTMENFWVCSWFQRILSHAAEIEAEGGSHKNHIFIADRSPLSAVFYSRHGELLLPLIKKQMEEIKAAAGVEIVTTHINVDDGVLWERIKARLLLEPERTQLKEDTYEWMKQVRSFYDNFEWDIEVDNTEEDQSKSLNKLMHKLLLRFCNKSERYDNALKLTSPNVHTATRKGFLQENTDNQENSRNIQNVSRNMKELSV
mmetsp:Transcript_3058/g.3789  ORF Transcript_3058/g.3789 Transcript_3058/m.3789 type:complete len:247 (-) Transcript_3058:105-845(-)